MMTSSPCSFCNLNDEALYEHLGSAICEDCVETARAHFDKLDSSPLVRFDLAYGGHETAEQCRMTLTGSQLGRIVGALTDAGVVAGVQGLANDRRLRAAADFSPDRDRVVEQDRVTASLAVELGESEQQLLIRRLGTSQVGQIQEFLTLASFHGGYTVRRI
jgi:hypothetical protein